jgi:septal ring-binding cell division protein DamX
MKKIEEKELEVFRIQIFESTVASIARAEAKRFQNILGDTVYINFETPLYKLRIGNYANRKNAEDAIESISKLGAKDAWIIRTKKVLGTDR